MITILNRAMHQIRIKPDSFSLFPIPKMWRLFQVCGEPDTNHQSELVKRNVFLPLRRILARVSVRRGSRRTYLSTFLLSRAFSLSTFSDFQ